MAATPPQAPAEFRRGLKRFLPHFLKAQAEGLNEADTVQRISKLFEEVMGYDALSEITFEAQMKGKFVDMALKVDGKIRLLVEAKAAGVVLRDRHIEQAQSYASQNNFKWVLLTNGVSWILYHLTFDEGIEYEKAFEVTLDGDGVEHAADHLALLRRDAIRKGHLESYWQKAAALGAPSIGRALFSETIIKGLRAEVRRNEGLLIDIEDLAKTLHDMMSLESREALGPVRIRKKRARKASVGNGQSEQPVIQLPAS